MLKFKGSGAVQTASVHVSFRYATASAVTRGGLSRQSPCVLRQRLQAQLQERRCWMRSR
jgi:hypothetical protein